MTETLNSSQKAKFSSVLIAALLEFHMRYTICPSTVLSIAVIRYGWKITDASAMRKPMGRPPLGLEMTMIRLPKGTGKRINSVMQGKGKRSVFIRSAIEQELRRREELKKKRPK